jgi:hypothetical protein
LAFTWTITTVLTLAAIIVSGVMMVHTHKTLSKRLSATMNINMNNNDDGNDDNEGGNNNDSSDRQYQGISLLATMGPRAQRLRLYTL